MPTYTIKVLSAEKIIVQDTGEHLLSVLFAISKKEEEKNEEVVYIARHGYPLETTPEALEIELQKTLSTYVTDSTNAARNAEFAEKDAQADATIADIVGKEISN